MAMLIQEYLNEHNGSHAKVQIFATDIDEMAITRPVRALPRRYRRGRGRRAAEALLHEEGRPLAGDETASGDGRLRPPQPDQGPPFSRLDLLVCRNFLIYLNPDMQKRLIPLFHQVLKPGGFLFLGAAETVGTHSDLFTPVDKKWKIYTRLEGEQPR